MDNNELDKRNTPVIVIDNSLKKYKDMPLFQEKVDKANDMLKNVGLPDFTRRKAK